LKKVDQIFIEKHTKKEKIRIKKTPFFEKKRNQLIIILYSNFLLYIYCSLVNRIEKSFDTKKQRKKKKKGLVILFLFLFSFQFLIFEFKTLKFLIQKRKSQDLQETNKKK